jgi:hypothetical protein
MTGLDMPLGVDDTNSPMFSIMDGIVENATPDYKMGILSIHIWVCFVALLFDMRPHEMLYLHQKGSITVNGNLMPSKLVVEYLARHILLSWATKHRFEASARLAQISGVVSAEVNGDALNTLDHLSKIFEATLLHAGHELAAHIGAEEDAEVSSDGDAFDDKLREYGVNKRVRSPKETICQALSDSCDEQKLHTPMVVAVWQVLTSYARTRGIAKVLDVKISRIREQRMSKIVPLSGQTSYIDIDIKTPLHPRFVAEARNKYVAKCAKRAEANSVTKDALSLLDSAKHVESVVPPPPPLSAPSESCMPVTCEERATKRSKPPAVPQEPPVPVFSVPPPATPAPSPATPAPSPAKPAPSHQEDTATTASAARWGATPPITSIGALARATTEPMEVASEAADPPRPPLLSLNATSVSDRQAVAPGKKKEANVETASAAALPQPESSSSSSNDDDGEANDDDALSPRGQENCAAQLQQMAAPAPIAVTSSATLTTKSRTSPKTGGTSPSPRQTSALASKKPRSANKPNGKRPHSSGACMLYAFCFYYFVSRVLYHLIFAQIRMCLVKSRDRGILTALCRTHRQKIKKREARRSLERPRENHRQKEKRPATSRIRLRLSQAKVSRLHSCISVISFFFVTLFLYNLSLKYVDLRLLNAGKAASAAVAAKPAASTTRPSKPAVAIDTSGDADAAAAADDDDDEDDDAAAWDKAESALHGGFRIRF